MQDQFTAEEVEVLREVVRHKVDEVDVEISRADALQFKSMLKHRRDVLANVLEKLTGTTPAQGGTTLV
jgi:hypothetical protein